MLFSLVIVLLGLLASTTAKAGETITYKDGDTVLEGYLARTAKKDAPVVLVVHQWKGLGPYEKGRADMLAKEGYNAFAIDMYGQGVRAANIEEAGKLAGIYKGDPELARQRIAAALAHARTLENADTKRIAVMGYCFGGTMALELARSGADFDGVVSFHGGLASKAPATTQGVIKPSVLVLHGAADPFVKPDEVKTFRDEMNTARADWVFTEYAYAVHSFTEKEAGNDPGKGAAYNALADARSWTAALDFLKDVFSRK